MNNPVRLADINEQIIEKAKSKASELGHLRNSIEEGDGNLAGFIGEALLESYLLNATEANSYDYDLIWYGYTIDVKTKRRSVNPKPFYECSICDKNTTQKCDIYAFVSLTHDKTDKEKFLSGWLCGFLPSSLYYSIATFHKKGEIDENNNFTFREDCYNVPISQLRQFSEFIVYAD